MSATKSLDEYKEYYKSAIQPSYDKRVANLNETAEKQKQENTDLYNTAVAKTEESYDDDYELNSVQRLVNERQLKENMANLGLTNSGLYNSNMLANEKNYETKNRQLDEDKQKTLTELANKLSDAVAEIDTALDLDLADLEQDFEKDATDFAKDIHIADLDHEAQMAQAQATSDAAEIIAESNERIAKSQQSQTSIQPKTQTETVDINVVANSDGVKNFKAAILTKGEFLRRKRTSTIDGKTITFKTYEDYIYTLMESWYNKDKLTEIDVSWLKGLYEID